MLTPLVITPELARHIEKIMKIHENMLFLPANAILDAAAHDHFFAFSHPLHPLVFYSIRAHLDYWELGSMYAPGLGNILIQDFETKRKSLCIPYGLAISSVEKIIQSLTKKLNPFEYDFPEIITEERKYTHEGKRKFCIVWK